jgi:hypothetical protein
VVDPLRAIGFEEKTIRRLIREYPENLLQEWADVTLAAQERHGERFFTRSPRAFFIDNLQNAAAGRRTPPDWWNRLRKSEEIPRCQVRHSDTASFPTSTADILHGASSESDVSMSEAVRSFIERQN